MLVKHLNYSVLRYTNVYGPRQNPHGEAGVVAIFCDKLLHGVQPVINGDGLQTRDYVYVGDVVRANLLVLSTKGSDTFNVSTAMETDVNAIFQILNDNLGSPATEKHAEAKAGEQLRSVCTFEKIKIALDWEPMVPIREGLLHTLDFFRKQYARE